MNRRVLYVLALALAAPVLPATLAPAARVARAEECQWCHKEIEEGRGSFNCKSCQEEAVKIARSAPQWTLEFQHDKPQRITVKSDARADDTYWWFHYTLKNIDQEPHAFTVSISAESDKGKNLAHYYDVAVPEVVTALKRKLSIKEGEQLWSQAELNVSPQGQAHAPPSKDPPSKDQQPTKDGPAGAAQLAFPVLEAGKSIRCVAIFRAFDTEMDRLKITVKGLSSDVELEVTDQPFRRKVRSRVLEIEYESPGDEFMTCLRPLTFVGQKWTEVETIIKTDLR